MTDNVAPRVFGGRYEIQRKIARGGMADVFYARDNLLDRPVALKVLFPELSVDPSFVERFRREAQNAARLSHPNIVSVYDWGEDANTYFIVMELVEGKSLSQVLRDERRINVDRAAAIGAEVASALYFAHRNGVVHRDVKPGNVLIDERGAVKVTDFGIARARNTTENLTQTGAVMGTATYFSPEQAQGLSVDQRSDVYSLGVVLYEMVAGKPPFAGDNPVTIAYKHVRETPEPLRSIDAAIPDAFQTIVNQALTKSQDHRYQTAEDLRADLERFRRGQRVHATASAPVDATQAVPTAAAGRMAHNAYAQGTRMNPSINAARTTPSQPKRRIAGPLMLFGLLIAAAAFGLVFLLNGGLSGSDPTPVSVPDVVGQNEDDATATLRDLDLRVSVTRQENSAAAGTVLSQDPAGGSTSETGNVVTLAVSRGPGDANVPNVVGSTEAEARQRLQQAGFGISVTRASSDTVEEGSVIRQDPSRGVSLEQGENVTITVSTGPQTVRVPSLEGFAETAARGRLNELGLQSTVVDEASSRPAGTVLRTDPGANANVPRGSTVTIYVAIAQQEPDSTTTTSTTTPNGE